MSPASPHHKHRKGGNVVLHVRPRIQVDRKSSAFGPEAGKPQAVRSLEGGALGSPARCYGGEGESQAARHARFVSADLEACQIGHPRSQACEACGGTAPRPTAATPRERAPRRARMTTDIAKVRRIVKNKVRTYPLPSLSPVRERVACAAGRERGRVRPTTPPLPAHSVRHPPPQRGEGSRAPSCTRSRLAFGVRDDGSGVIPGRSAAEGKGIYPYPPRHGSPSLADARRG